MNGNVNWFERPADEALIVGDTIPENGLRYRVVAMDNGSPSFQTLDPFADMVELIEEVLDG